MLLQFSIIINKSQRISNMQWVSNLCNCFSPQMRKHIIGYLSASQLNNQVIQQQKCTQQIQDEYNQGSIYQQIKQRSYYNIQQTQQIETLKTNPLQSNQLQLQDQLCPSNYPSNLSLDQIFNLKLKSLKHLLNQQINEQYQKVYDSQDQNSLIIYARNQIQKGKKFNVYRFVFNVPHTQHPLTPKQYVTLQTIDDGKSFIQSLLKNRQFLKKTQQNLQIYYRTYQKKLIISQHDFVTAQKTIIEQELDEDLSTQGKQIYDQIAYTVIFSVKGIKDEKSVVFNRGNINLCGMKAYMKNNISKNVENEQESTGKVKELTFEGYINIQLDTPINANMLKQPAAKQIRVFIQKLIFNLQKCDAI